MIRASFSPSKQFFFDRQRVIDSLAKAKRSRMAKQGATVRLIARRSIRPARRVRLGDLLENERTSFQIRVAKATSEGKAAPLLPFAASKPGDPPRSRTGLLRSNILFAYDPETESVVVGPARLNAATDAPSVLEYGGDNDRGVFIDPRPYMRPALFKAVSNYPQLFKDSLQ